MPKKPKSTAEKDGSRVVGFLADCDMVRRIDEYRAAQSFPPSFSAACRRLIVERLDAIDFEKEAARG